MCTSSEWAILPNALRALSIDYALHLAASAAPCATHFQALPLHHAYLCWCALGSYSVHVGHTARYLFPPAFRGGRAPPILRTKKFTTNPVRTAAATVPSRTPVTFPMVTSETAQAMMTQQLNMLKYIMDYPAEKEIGLLPVNTDSIATVALTGLSENLYELQLLQSQVQLAERQKRLISNGYIPSLNLTGNWRFAAYTDEAYHWFHSGPSNHWFRSYGVGLTLRIPIFDGLDKKYKIRKAMIDIETMKLSRLDTRKNLQTQYLNAVNDLMNNQRNFKKQKDNYLLAEEVYTVTTDRYREGITSMTEVLQDEMRMSEAQNNYISAHYNYRVTNLMLLKLTGQISSLFK